MLAYGVVGLLSAANGNRIPDALGSGQTNANVIPEPSGFCIDLWSERIGPARQTAAAAATVAAVVSQTLKGP